jgi:hypothetical protein
VPGRVASCQRSSASVASLNSRAALASVQLVEIGARAEIGEQQEALSQVLRQHLGRVHAGFMQHARDVHERPAVFPLGRRVHHDVAAAVGEGGAPVAAEAGVGGSRGEGEGRAAQFLAQLPRSPGLRCVAPYIGVYH